MRLSLNIRIGSPADHKEKKLNKQACRRRMVGENRTTRPGRKKMRSYQSSVKLF
jgi:hypothetical protein